MININSEKVAEVLYYHILHESLDDFILDPVLIPYEDNEELHEIVASAIDETGKKYFKLGYLLGKL